MLNAKPNIDALEERIRDLKAAMIDGSMTPRQFAYALADVLNRVVDVLTFHELDKKG